MDIKLHNTLGNKIDTFTPINKGEVKMYHCGPTVYNHVHIGNLRAFFLADLLRRLFEYEKYEVKQVMNITDVDDKTIKRSQEEKISLKDLTQKYERAFFDDLASLNILKPKSTPRASESINEMISIISKLLETDFAYKADDGVYFRIEKSDKYGEIVNLTRREKNSIERIKNDEYDKENPQDFALWKFHTEADGEVFWDAPFGKGRPGWHIECSAMAMQTLGETIDIHTGGIDLTFPHHTNEIAQSEAVTGKKYVNYWIHNGFISINNTKLSKSLKNEIYLKDIIEKGISPLAYRYWLLTSHYQSLANFTWESLEASATAYHKLVRFISTNLNLTEVKPRSEIVESIVSPLYNNLETPQSIASIWELIKNQELPLDEKIVAILEADKILGLDLLVQAKKLLENENNIPDEIKKLADERLEAREKKDFNKSDEIRSAILNAGYEIEDSVDGQKIRKS